MSQWDVANAKKALAARLAYWETPGDCRKLADGFIDELVRIGWQMSPHLESRPVPPRTRDACRVCGKTEHDCTRNPYSEHEFAPVITELKGHLKPRPAANPHQPAHTPEPEGASA